MAVGYDYESGACSVVTAAVVAAAVVAVAGTDTIDGLPELDVPTPIVGGGRAEREGTFTLVRPPSAPHVAVERRELFPMYGARARDLIDLHVWRSDAAQRGSRC